MQPRLPTVAASITRGCRRNSCPTFERNKVHGGHPGGFYCHGDGDEGDEGYCLPTLDHNEIYANEGKLVN